MVSMFKAPVPSIQMYGNPASIRMLLLANARTLNLYPHFLIDNEQRSTNILNQYKSSCMGHLSFAGRDYTTLSRIMLPHVWFLGRLYSAPQEHLLAYCCFLFVCFNSCLYPYMYEILHCGFDLHSWISDWASFHGSFGYLCMSGDMSIDLCLFEWDSVGLLSVDCRVIYINKVKWNTSEQTTERN